jgi:hypothetical protein
LLLPHFFLSIDIGAALRMSPPLYNKYNNLERRTQGSSLLITILCIFVLPWLTFACCILAPFFSSRSNGLAANIGSLAPGLNGHALRVCD